MRKIQLSPVEGAILRLLEEAGSEEPGTLFVSLHPFTGSEIEQARQSLLQAGFIGEEANEVFLTEAGRGMLSR